MKYIFLIYCLFFSILPSVYGNDIFLNKELYSIHYGQHNGLPNTHIFDLAQDSNGFIYIATAKGLYRYDGFSFQSMTENIDNYMGGSALSVSGSNQLFFESFDGYVYKFYQNTWQSFNKNKPIHFLQYGIYKDSLFVVQKQGVDIYSITDSKYLQTVSFNVGSPQHSIQVGADFFIINEDYIIKTGSTSLKQKLSIKEISSTKTIRQIYHHNNYLYIISRSAYKEGIAVLDLNLNLVKKIQVNEVDGIVQHLDFIDNKIWISTNKGIYIYQLHETSWTFVQKIFNGSNVTKVLKGKNNEYWISVIGQGLYLIPNHTQFVHSFPNENITRITTNVKGFLVGTNKGNLYQLTNNLNAARWILQDPMKTPINYLYNSSVNNDIFYVSSLGFYHNSTKKSQFYDMALKSVAELDHKYYALATSSHLLLYPKNNHESSPSVWDSVFTQKRKEQEFSYLLDGVRAKVVCYDQKLQNIYVLTNAGLFVINSNGHIKELLIKNESIIADQMLLSEQQLYCLSYSGELYIISAGKTQKLDISSRIFDFRIAEKKIILKTNNGFVIYDKHKKSYSRVSFKCDPESISDFFLNGNQLIVLLPSGLTVIDVETDHTENNFPSFIIENIKIGTRTSYETNLLNKLPYDSNSFEINYAIPDYTYPSSYSLYYRMNKGNWQKLPLNSRKLQFHQLTSGNYEIDFKINDTELNNKVRFTIERPYWETWWFYLILSVTAIAVLSYYYQCRRKKLQQQIKLLEEKVTLEKKLGKSILTSIKAQMNPHFYFNALNSIQAFIYKNDKKHALEYLSKFSKLTRNILSQTELDTILLEEEISMLQLYLDLEKVRFSNKFTYSIECSIETDIRNIRIPPMLIQPYVENSVKHGFNKLTTDGLIKIIFEASENHLHVIVEDNGIGREQSSAIKKSQTQNSFSSEANKKRLEILNSSTDKKVSVLYEDILNDSGQVNGTRVKIFIPINNEL